MKNLRKFAALVLAAAMSFGTVELCRPVEPVIETVQAKTIEADSLTLKVGEQAQLKAKGAKKKVKWTSDHKEVAAVDNKGLVTALSGGTATITAKSGKKKFLFAITVEADFAFSEWNLEAPALHTLTEYVEAVTDEASPDFIPVKDRIAVFDMDGTLAGELYPTYFVSYIYEWRVLKDETFRPDEAMITLAEEIRDAGLTNAYTGEMIQDFTLQFARAFAGMTQGEFCAYAKEILNKDADGFTGMTYAESFFRPMIEVVDYLQENDFTVFVCSGTDRALCRVMLDGIINIPNSRVIGSDVEMEASGQQGQAGMSYEMTPEDEMIRTDRPKARNEKMNKVSVIAEEIGSQPVLSFGNSGGDISMHVYTISNNKYKSAAFMLLADDDERDYGNPEKAAGSKAKWEGYGFNVVSMKNDFRTIYGDEVKKTGSFRWPEEFGAENATK